MFQNLIQDSLMAMPILGWAVLGIFVLIIQILSQKVQLALIATVVGLLGLIVFSAVTFDSSVRYELFFGTAVLDFYSQIFNLIGLFTALGVVLTLIPGIFNSTKLFQTSYEQLPEMLVCLLLSGFGLGVLVSAVDLTTLFLGLETLSIGLYCLCGFYRTEIQSTESGFKYLLIGAFSTVIFLYGIAFIYGATGATRYSEIFAALQKEANPLASIGSLFLIAGFAFKLAFVPFHLYTADVYEGAPTPITGYLSTIVKIGGLAAGLRVFWGFLEPLSTEWQPLWLSLCILSIFVGNLGALQQKTLKKLFAFSSVANAGFLGLGLVVARPQVGTTFPLISYLIVYTSMTLGVFALISYLEERGQVFLVEDLKGFAQKKFLVAVVLSIFVLSLAGLPPFAGFMVKFWTLQALVEQKLLGFAVVAALGSLIGAAYYLKLLMFMFMSSEQGAVCKWVPAQDRFFSLRFVVVLTLLITLLGGIRPQLYADWFFSAIALK